MVMNVENDPEGDSQRTTPIDRPGDGGADDDTVIVDGDAPSPGLGGRRIGRYTLVKELGHGGQGFVWLAEDTALRRRVALKMLTSQAAMSQQARIRFHREAEVASKLDHPGICGVLEFGEHDGLPFIAMPFLDGEALDGKIRSALEARASGATVSQIAVEPRPIESGSSATPGRRAVVDVVEFIEDAALAVHAAHEAGLIHRDIKPGNIMMKSDGRAVILDFGLARDESGAGRTLTQTGDFFGTPAYMSPEQLTGQRVKVDHRSDVWSLGVTMFECLTLRRPFDGPSREALYQAILTKEAPGIRQLNPAVPRDLEVVVHTALEKDRDRRYQSALQLAEELRRVRQQRPIVARPVGPWTRAIRWAQRNQTVAMLIALVFVAMGGAIGIFAWKNSEVESKNLELGASNVALERKTEEAAENAARARAEATAKGLALDRLREEKTRVQNERDRVVRLKDRRVVRLMQERADRLFPAHPDLIADLEQWLADSRELLDRLPLHRQSLAEFEAKAGPYTDAQKAHDHPDAWRLLRSARARLDEAEEAVMEAESEADERRHEAEADRIEGEIAALEARMTERKSWGLDSEEAWVHELLRDLVAELEEFGGTVTDVRGRLALASEMGPRTLEDHAVGWEAACARIRASKRYEGLALVPTVGLIPLGPDPSSDLEEFLHWPSHARGSPLPQRNDEGRFEVGAKTGIILVLLPGGRFLMGAQADDPSQPNYDPQADRHEKPVHQVALSPFFAGKHEVTRGQFVRMSGRPDPSYWTPETSNRVLKAEDLPRLPVERVSWIVCDEVARRAGLSLPTEAQWEYACRAGSSDVFFFGNDSSRLGEHDNVRDRAWSSGYHEPSGLDVDDGHVVVAPAGSYAPNAFGLHDLHGNLQEWCADWYGESTYARRKGTPLDPRGPATGSLRILRGGSWNTSRLGDYRSAFRDRNDPANEYVSHGFRVVRAL